MKPQTHLAIILIASMLCLGLVFVTVPKTIKAHSEFGSCTLTLRINSGGVSDNTSPMGTQSDLAWGIQSGVGYPLKTSHWRPNLVGLRLAMPTGKASQSPPVAKAGP